MALMDTPMATPPATAPPCLPRIIQGGMGVGISHWRLAREVARLGHLGVVSGTALDLVLARRLQQGDPEGTMRRAMARFPIPEIARQAEERYFSPEGLRNGDAYRAVPMPRIDLSRDHLQLIVLANFVEVSLAKEGHGGTVGINFLEKIQIPTLAAIYGAMLAGADYICMGAGIPNHIPGVIDKLALGEAVSLKVDVAGGRDIPGDEAERTLFFDPREFWQGQGEPPKLKRPEFLAIVSSFTLALSLARKATGRITGFVVEGSRAGGHNAPPRGPMKLTERGEPVYGERDAPDLERFRDLGYPFWLAGSYGAPGKLAEALAEGATGIQVGTPFAFCEESGMDAGVKRRVLEKVRHGSLEVYTDPQASPTGFPFKVVALEGTAFFPGIGWPERRVCDVGVLRHIYARPDGTVGYRCPSEAVDDYVRKGGLEAETRGKKCLCNGLLAAAGLGRRDAAGLAEPPLVTAGDSLVDLGRFLPAEGVSYSASSVLEALLR